MKHEKQQVQYFFLEGNFSSASKRMSSDCTKFCYHILEPPTMKSKSKEEAKHELAFFKAENQADRGKYTHAPFGCTEGPITSSFWPPPFG